jgi:ribosome-associated protein
MATWLGWDITNGCYDAARYGPAMARDVPIRGDMIRLGQLLKLAGIADDGGAAKALLAAGSVAVNGEREARRGRQLHDGDEVAVGSEVLRVTTG